MSDAPIVQVDGNRVTYRASSLGMCTRALVAARQGYEVVEVPEKLKEVFRAGHEAEEEYFREDATAARFPERQEEVILNITSKIKIVGHVDGSGFSHVGEVKSQSTEAFEKWTHDSWSTDPLWKKYAWQVSVYMLATGKELALIRKDRGDSWKPVAFTFYEKPFHSLTEIRSRVLLIESLAAEDELPPCEGEEWGCPFRYLHEGPELVDDPQINSWVLAYNHWKKEKQEVDKGLADARKRLQDLMPSDRIILPSGVLITRSEYETREHIVKASKGTRLTITEPKGNNASRSE